MLVDVVKSPIAKAPLTPTPPNTTKSPVEKPVETFPLPTYRDPPIPTPPETTKAPVVVEPEPVVCVIETVLVDVLFVKVADPLTEEPAEA